jgi:hypothetical protein
MIWYTLASDPLAAWGQAAAILLVIELFLFILIALALVGGAMFAFAWVREKAELVKKLRPVVDSVNRTTEAALNGTLPPPQPDENKLIRTVAQLPAQVKVIDQKIERGSSRVADAVIEFRARTVQAKTIAKAFFLPGLMRRELSSPSARPRMGIRSPGLQKLLEAGAPEIPVARDDGHSVMSSQTSDVSAR